MEGGALEERAVIGNDLLARARLKVEDEEPLGDGAERYGHDHAERPQERRADHDGEQGQHGVNLHRGLVDARHDEVVRDVLGDHGSHHRPEGHRGAVEEGDPGGYDRGHRGADHRNEVQHAGEHAHETRIGVAGDHEAHARQAALNQGVDDRRAEVAAHGPGDHGERDAVVVSAARAQHEADLIVDARVVADEPEGEDQAEKHREHRGGEVAHGRHDPVAERREQRRDKPRQHALERADELAGVNVLAYLLKDVVLALEARDPRAESRDARGQVAQEVGHLREEERDDEREEQHHRKGDHDDAQNRRDAAWHAMAREPVDERRGHVRDEAARHEEQKHARKAPQHHEHDGRHDDRPNDGPHPEAGEAHARRPLIHVSPLLGARPAGRRRQASRPSGSILS